MKKLAKHLFAAAIFLRCLLAPQSSCGDVCDLIGVFAYYGPELVGMAGFLTYQILVPLAWMEPETAGNVLINKAPPPSTDCDGSIWPLGFGFNFPQGQFPGEAASVAPVDVGVFSIRHANIYGVQAAGLIAKATDTCAGISVGGFGSAAGTVYGIQAGGLFSSCRSDLYGLQVAGYANGTPGLCAGMQAGVVNMAGDVYGAQVGFTNRGGNVRGMQIGVVNLAQNMQGVQIGLVNIIKDNGAFPASPLVNMGF